MTDIDPKRIAFGISGPTVGDATDKTTLIIGIPKPAWEYMKDGKTHHFTLESADIPIQIILFGAKTHDLAISIIKEANRVRGFKTEDRTKEDFSIKPKADTSKD